MIDQATIAFEFGLVFLVIAFLELDRIRAHKANNPAKSPALSRAESHRRTAER